MAQAASSHNGVGGAVPASVSCPRSLGVLLFGSGWYRHYEEALRLACPAARIFDADKADACKRVDALLQTSGGLHALIVVAYGSGGSPASEQRFQALQSRVRAWVSSGGILLVHGERHVDRLFKQWFGLPWSCSDYLRTLHSLNGANAVLCAHAALPPLLPARLNVKAVMLRGAKESEALHWATSANEGEEAHSVSAVFPPSKVDPDLCATALARVQCGHVAFFGDVNAEQDTIDTMRTLAMRLPASLDAIAHAAAPSSAAAPLSDVRPPGGIPVPEQQPPPPAKQHAHAPAARSQRTMQCSSCRSDLLPGQFTASQKQKGGARRCKRCVQNSRPEGAGVGRGAGIGAGNAASGARAGGARQQHGAGDSPDPYASDGSDDGEDDHDDDKDDDLSWFDADPPAFDRFGIRSDGAGLCSAVSFPRWRFVTDEHDPSLTYFTDPYESAVIKPRRHWTLLSEIVDSSMVGMGIGRNRVQLRDRSGVQHAALFYQDGDIDARLLLRSQGLVLAVRYAEKHGFMDMTIGLRIEHLRFVMGQARVRRQTSTGRTFQRCLSLMFWIVVCAVCSVAVQSGGTVPDARHPPRRQSAVALLAVPKGAIVIRSRQGRQHVGRSSRRCAGCPLSSFRLLCLKFSSLPLRCVLVRSLPLTRLPAGALVDSQGDVQGVPAAA